MAIYYNYISVEALKQQMFLIPKYSFTIIEQFCSVHADITKPL